MYFSNISIKLAKSKRFYYGWIILALSSLAYFFSGPGQTYFFSLFIDHYVADFGWTRSTISSLYTIATLISGMILFTVGRLTDKYGQKKILIIVGIVLGITCIWNSYISAIWMLFVGFLLGRFTGQGSMTLVSSTLIPNWFIRKRALAFSIMSVGHMIASTVVPPFNTWLIGVWDWNNVWRLWGILLFVIFVPFTFVFLYNKPEDLGLKPYNGVDKSKEYKEDETSSWTLKEALKTPSFWGMSYCQILLPLISTGLVFHFISILGTKGLEPLTASLILSIIAFTSFPANLLAGVLLDKFKVNHFSALISILIFASLSFLLFSSSIYTIIVFGVLQGIALGFQSVTGNTVWPSYYGSKNLGSIKGIVIAFTVVASALGPLPLGLNFDATGNYNYAIILLMILPAIGIIIALLSKKPEKKSKEL